jgi:RNase P subunit RPR2
MMVSMFHGPSNSLHDFVIRCKRCGENIAAPVNTMPDSWIIHTCPLCGERRRYLPAEIFQGRLSYKYQKIRVRHGA